MKNIFVGWGILFCFFMGMADPVLLRAGEMDFVVPPKAEGKKRSTMEAYVLQPGDRVKITIYPEDTYIKGGEMQISSEGNIALPLIGKVDVANRKIIEAEAAILKLIENDYLVNPEVVIEVLKQGRQNIDTIVLLGAVRKPGTFEFPAGERKVTLLKLLSDAGGFSEVANIKKIKIVRTSDGKKKVIHANAEDIMSGNTPDMELQSGDIVHVGESIF